METKEQLQKLEKAARLFQEEIVGNKQQDYIQARSLKIVQMNIGRKCNQSCAHCHVGANPSRSEMMEKETIEKCLHIIHQYKEIETVDITGGAPEMNPFFTHLAEESKKAGKHVIDRCNLTILEEPGYEFLYEFLAEHKIEIIASLPHFQKESTEKLRGKGVFEKSIIALQKLNQLGYGRELPLNLVYNPAGFFLSSPQRVLEREFKEKLKTEHNIEFTNLYCINNFPINRFLEQLIKREKLQSYMETLVNAFNPTTLDNLMCRDQISVSYDGAIYDCDFNQMLDVKADPIMHINEFDYDKIVNRKIKTANHCYSCTAGSGSSCGGEIV